MRKSSRFSKPTILWCIITLLVYGGFMGMISLGYLRVSQQIAWVTIGLNIILAASLNLILGVSGLFSLGHAGFMAIGAYTTAITLQSIPTVLGFWLGMFIGIVLTALVALVVAIPTLRLKGDYLAIATLGVSEIIRIIITNLGITNGAVGLTRIPRFVSFTTVFVVVIVVMVIISMLASSRFGRTWKGIADDDIASSSMGVPVTRYRISVFLIGACIASVAGALYASFFTAIQPNLFDFQKSVDILVIVVLGGMGSLTGSVFAAIVIGLINITFQSFAQERIIVYSILLIVMMIFRPRGLFGNGEISFNFLKKEGVKDDVH